jgi:hypothetical protein
VRLEGLGQLKITVTSSGIEPATFRHHYDCIVYRHVTYVLVLFGHSVRRSVFWVMQRRIVMGALLSPAPPMRSDSSYISLRILSRDVTCCDWSNKLEIILLEIHVL